MFSVFSCSFWDMSIRTIRFQEAILFLRQRLQWRLALWDPLGSPGAGPGTWDVNLVDRRRQCEKSVRVRRMGRKIAHCERLIQTLNLKQRRTKTWHFLNPSGVFAKLWQAYYPKYPTGDWALCSDSVAMRGTWWDSLDDAKVRGNVWDRLKASGCGAAGWCSWLKSRCKMM